MSILQRFERRTRNFRLTLLLSLFVAFFVMSNLSQGQPGSEPEKGPETEPIKEQPQAPPSSEPKEQPASIEGDQLGGELKTLKRNTEALLLGLGGHISESTSAEDTELEEALLALSNAQGKNALHERLKDPEKAGTYIHKLRRRSFIPLKSLLFVGKPKVSKESLEKKAKGTEEEASQLIKEELIGIITIQDGRSRVVKITGVKADNEWKVQDIRRPDSTELGANGMVTQIIQDAKASRFSLIWNNSSPLLKEGRSLEQLTEDLKSLEILDAKGFKWNDSSEIEGGYRINGSAELEDGRNIPFFAAFLETEKGLALLSIQETTGFIDRIKSGRADTLDISLLIVAIALILGFIYILFSYGKGLKGCPRELYLLFFTKVMEYSAYGAAQLAFMFYLREDIGLSDIVAGSYYSGWSVGLTMLTMGVGAICDAIGIKRTLLVGCFSLLFSRIVMPFSNELWVTTLFGFIPLAFGIAITGPVLSVGIKRFTTIEGAALGFGLFYTLMNVGWAVGAWLFDFVRVTMGDQGEVSFLGDTLSTYQVLLGVGFFITLPNLLAILWMRRGVEMTEDGVNIPNLEKKVSDKSAFQSLIDGTKDGIKSTIKIFGENFAQRAFWVFILLISVTVFARLTFFHFHITWPSYGIRYFGQGSLIGNIFGVLNPVMIVFLVPVIAYFTRKIRSYWMLLVGTIISVSSIFFVVITPDNFNWMIDSWFGSIVFERWLEVPDGFRDPYYLSMVLFVSTFTFGEAIWSPRLMQFTAEIAPPGREGSYISLAYLPYFGAKFVAGPMAGLLLAHYTPEFGVDGIYHNYPDHQMIWWWVGGSALLTPIGLVALRRLYKAAEDRAEQAAKEKTKELSSAEAEA